MTKTTNTPFTSNDHERISQCISNVLNHYFNDMENHFDGDLFNLVISEVERPLIQKVMDYSKNNQTNAAAILGISRGTLRKKIKQYQVNPKAK